MCGRGRCSSCFGQSTPNHRNRLCDTRAVGPYHSVIRVAARNCFSDAAEAVKGGRNVDISRLGRGNRNRSRSRGWSEPGASAILIAGCGLPLNARSKAHSIKTFCVPLASGFEVVSLVTDVTETMATRSASCSLSGSVGEVETSDAPACAKATATRRKITDLMADV